MLIPRTQNWKAMNVISSRFVLRRLKKTFVSRAVNAMFSYVHIHWIVQYPKTRTIQYHIFVIVPNAIDLYLDLTINVGGSDSFNISVISLKFISHAYPMHKVD